MPSSQSYQLDVKGMATLTSIKQIGEQSYGKGQVEKHLIETIRLDQVKQILEDYAEATNQTTSSLVKNKQLADASNPANQFIRREFGGPVTAGVPYIVGEKRPEMFVPSESGFILPHVTPELSSLFSRTPGDLGSKMGDKVRQRAQAAAAAASLPSSSSSPSSSSGQGGRLSAVMVAGLTDTLSDLKEQIARIKSLPHGEALRLGVAENPDAIGDGLSEATNRDGLLMSRILKKQGNS